jgi:hypothetical protein
MRIFNKYICAECGCDTLRINGQVKRYSIAQSKPNLSNYFNQKDINIIENPFVCKKCYYKLTDFIKNGKILSHLRNKNGFQVKTGDIGIDKIKFDDKRCNALTGMSIEQFEDVFGNIVSNWNHRISQKDTLFIYLSILRLGNIFSKNRKKVSFALLKIQFKGISLNKAMHIFKIESQNYRNLCRLINFVRDQVFFSLVPISMGFNCVSRSIF